MAKDGLGKRIKAALALPETLPSMRRHFVSTIFDATFVMLGVIIGSALSSHPQHDIIITTMITSAFALVISTGTSVYEAESLEQNRRMDEIGRAMLSRVEDTEIGRAHRTSIALIAGVNSMGPLVVGLVTISPIILFPVDQVVTAAQVSVGLAIVLMFVTGYIMGRSSGKSPIMKGARMALIGVIAYVLCYLIGGAV